MGLANEIQERTKHIAYLEAERDMLQSNIRRARRWLVIAAVCNVLSLLLALFVLFY